MPLIGADGLDEEVNDESVEVNLLGEI